MKISPFLGSLRGAANGHSGQNTAKKEKKIVRKMAFFQPR